MLQSLPPCCVATVVSALIGNDPGRTLVDIRDILAVCFPCYVQKLVEIGANCKYPCVLSGYTTATLSQRSVVIKTSCKSAPSQLLLTLDDILYDFQTVIRQHLSLASSQRKTPSQLASASRKKSPSRNVACSGRK
jgi:pyridoxal/pyridoxine/pyridoxamine kinase